MKVNVEAGLLGRGKVELDSWGAVKGLTGSGSGAFLARFGGLPEGPISVADRFCCSGTMKDRLSAEGVSTISSTSLGSSSVSGVSILTAFPACLPLPFSFSPPFLPVSISRVVILDGLGAVCLASSSRLAAPRRGVWLFVDSFKIDLRGVPFRSGEAGAAPDEGLLVITL